MDGIRYESGDRVWVRSGSGRILPGVVVGLYRPWGLFRVAYTVDIVDHGPKAIEEWRLSPRARGEGLRFTPSRK